MVLERFVLWLTTLALAQTPTPAPTQGEDLLSIIEVQIQYASRFDFVLILLVASVSITVGRSLLLLANQVSPRRFVTSVVIEALKFLLSYIFWVLLITVWCNQILGYSFSVHTVARIVARTYTPFYFGVLGLMPYLGATIIRVLEVLVVMSIWFILVVGFGLSPNQATVLIVVGGGLSLVAQRTLYLPLLLLQNRIAGTQIKGYREALTLNRLEF